MSEKKKLDKLTQLRPDVGEALVPETHVEVVVGRKEHGLLDRLLASGGGGIGASGKASTGLVVALELLGAEERAAVVSVGQDHGANAGKEIRCRELPEGRIVEGLEVQQAREPLDRQGREDIVPQVPESGQTRFIALDTFSLSLCVRARGKERVFVFVESGRRICFMALCLLRFAEICCVRVV